MNSQWDIERRSPCLAVKEPNDDNVEKIPSPCYDDELHMCERIVVLFIQLKNYLGSYWLAPWFFVYIYPSVLVYETHGFAGPFLYCNIIQMLFFIVFEFWDESFNWTPLHDTVRTYSKQIFGRQHITKNVDELILFSIWILSWAAIPTICFINEHMFELPSDRLERLTSYVSMMTVTFVMAYIFILLWIDMNLLEVKSCRFNQNTSTTLFTKSELIDYSIEPDEMPDLETVYEDISITEEFKINNILQEFSETFNENIDESEESYKYIKVQNGEEATEQEMDVISVSSGTLSDFDVITDEELNLLK